MITTVINSKNSKSEIFTVKKNEYGYDFCLDNKVIFRVSSSQFSEILDDLNYLEEKEV